MTIHLSAHASRRLTPPIPYAAGMVAKAVFTHTLTKAFTTATDFIELGSIPATARILGATVIGEGMTAGTTADIGTMTGEPGDDRDATRALTADLLFNDVDVVDNEASATALLCQNFPRDDAKHRGLGCKLSANEAAGAGKKVTVILEYTY